MTTEQNGLRFDIYERVHLSEGVFGIKELEGIELTPHIQVLPQGEQAVLRGNLLLTGTYVDEQGREGQTLEHLIPVEITLPLNRVQRVEDIAVEIENFDVDLLSARSLNITGVLSLNGLEVASAPEAPSWQETQEEVVFVHEVAERRAAEPTAPLFAVSGATRDAESEPPAASAAASENPERTPEEPGPAAVPVSALVEPEPVPVTVQEESAAPAPVQEEKKELKVAFSGKKSAEAQPETPVVKSFGLSSSLNPSAANQAKQDIRPEEEAEETEAAQNKVQWKNLLLNAKGEQQEFKRVRLCIVQKEETLETIAKRYEMNPREIALYNRLGDSDVTEGQIVYIPK
ncbi:LysM peptidoglycan-binding domain-containing protein [Paenibacillus sp. P26]|nr:LysM peptidoglycan-binding domain-containing protein [Paenibacillus sp. P26]UUZ89462.1 LysM peptidoglycan-binding domain-containing protein [Paenibacillus sp. P25]